MWWARFVALTSYLLRRYERRLEREHAVANAAEDRLDADLGLAITVGACEGPHPIWTRL